MLGGTSPGQAPLCAGLSDPVAVEAAGTAGGERRLLRRLCLCLLAIGIALSLAVSGLDGLTGGPATAQGQVGLPTQRGPIYEENHRPGTTSWQSAALTRAAAKRAPTRRDERPQPTWPGLPATRATTDTFDTWADTCVRGYADRASINVGQSVNLMVSTARPSVTLNIFRVGWYGGAGMSLKLTVPNLPGQNQPVPQPDSNGMVAANWAPSYTLQTDASWTSGVYLVKLTAPNCDEGYLHFVVRNDAQQ